eukprot:Lankesteria_metandrocarpae@DN4965_c0_g2_i1.p1
MNSTMMFIYTLLLVLPLLVAVPTLAGPSRSRSPSPSRSPSDNDAKKSDNDAKKVDNFLQLMESIQNEINIEKTVLMGAVDRAFTLQSTDHTSRKGVIEFVKNLLPKHFRAYYKKDGVPNPYDGYLMIVCGVLMSKDICHTMW